MPAMVQMKQLAARLLDDHVDKFTTLIGSSPMLYLKGICLNVFAAFEEDEGGSIESSLTYLQWQIATFENLHCNISSGESKLLASGSQVADDILKLQDIILQVSHVILCLEDLWGTASEGQKVLQTAY